jgi:hypothetical protein
MKHTFGAEHTASAKHVQHSTHSAGEFPLHESSQARVHVAHLTAMAQVAAAGIIVVWGQVSAMTACFMLLPACAGALPLQIHHRHTTTGAAFHLVSYNNCVIPFGLFQQLRPSIWSLITIAAFHLVSYNNCVVVGIVSYPMRG